MTDPERKLEWVGAGAVSDPDRVAHLTALGDATRTLMEAVVETDVDTDTMSRATAALRDITADLRATTRPSTLSMNPQAIRDRFIAYNPVIGVVNPYAPPLVVDVDADGHAVSRVQLSRVHEGPPNAVHGGIVSMLLDQLLGHAIGTAGKPGMTVKLTIRYRKPTPYDQELVIEAWHTGGEGRKVEAEGRITADGVVTAEAHGLFVTMTEDQRWSLLRGDDQSPLA
jgi:acyl-coenzyme A thioesterase PaaI-like protein